LQIRNKTILTVGLFGFVLLCRCAATSNAPRDWLPQPEELRREVYGSWIKLEYASNSNLKTQLSGELIAVNQDSIYIVDDVMFHALPLVKIQSGRLEAYRSDADWMSGWVMLGSLSTLSNGGFLIFTAPMWLIGGSCSSWARSREPMIDYQPSSWSRLIPYARYPQGLPLDFDRKHIYIKK
jgi:hypothetical protein